MKVLINTFTIMAFFAVASGLCFFLDSALKRFGASKKTMNRLAIVVLVVVVVTFIVMFGSEGGGMSSYADYWGDRARRR
jgi:dolichyl-phosphate-mannose--protein O-mannosyl transferase